MKSIRTKLLFSFGIIGIVILLIVSLNMKSSHMVTKQYDHVLYDNVYSMYLIDSLSLTQSQIVSNVRGYLTHKDEAFIQQFETLHDMFTIQMEELHEQFPEGTDLAYVAERIDRLAGNYNTLIPDLIESYQADDFGRFQRLSTQANAMNQQFFAFVTSLKEELDAQTDVQLLELEATVKRATLFSVIIAGVGLFSGLLIILILSRSIQRPLAQTTHALKEMAQGNLALTPLTITTKDETGQMANALNSLLNTWNTVIRKVNDSSRQVAEQAEQVSANTEESLASSEMVAKTAENAMVTSDEQELYVTRSSEALEQVEQGVTQITEDNARMLASAQQMEQAVSDGKIEMNEVVEQMKEIHETIQHSTAIIQEMAQKSNEIQEASALITGISEQTNLLALNAAIEAARAGEHGAGFAVVAEEVRNLAEESKRSATRIDRMILDIHQAAELAVRSIADGQQKVSEGIHRTNGSFKTFQQIEESVTDVHEQITSVSNASEQIQTMTQNVLRMANTLQDLARTALTHSQNTTAATEEQLAAMQEITASTERLHLLSEQLQQEMSQFKTN